MDFNQLRQHADANQQPEPEMGWDDVISNDGGDFEPVPEGDYFFTVTSFKRARHEGSEKMPPCNKAILTLALTSAWEPTEDNPEAQGEVTVNLFLNRKSEWKLCQFFTAIGQRKHGEETRMNWNAVPGSSGTCAVSTRSWTNKENNQTYTSNDVKRFYDPEKSPVKINVTQYSTTPPSRAQYPAQNQQPPAQREISNMPKNPSNPWTSGKF